MNIETLTPCRDLDAIVTEEVMGVCAHEPKEIGGGVLRLWCKKCGVEIAVDSNGRDSTLKHYSTHIAATKELMDKFKRWSVLRHGLDYTVSITTSGGAVTAQAVTFERAFSLAAVKAAEAS